MIIEYFHDSELNDVVWTVFDDCYRPIIWGDVLDLFQPVDKYMRKYLEVIPELYSLQKAIEQYQKIIDRIMEIPREERDNDLVKYVERLIAEKQKKFKAAKNKIQHAFEYAKKLHAERSRK